MFDQQIRPILEYASDIWCQPQPIEELERTQLKFLKKSIGVFQSTPTPAVLGETGRFPIHLRQEDSLLKLWARINLLPCTCTNILYKIYTDLLQLHNEGHDTWPGRVKAIFSMYGTDDREIDGLTTPAEYHNFLQTFREIRHNRYAQNWLSTIRNNEKSTKLRTYRLIKNDYRIEPHLLYVENKKHQRALTNWGSATTNSTSNLVDMYDLLSHRLTNCANFVTQEKLTTRYISSSPVSFMGKIETPC